MYGTKTGIASLCVFDYVLSPCIYIYIFHKGEKGNAKGILVGWLCLDVFAGTSEENEVLLNQNGEYFRGQKSCSIALKAEKQPQLWADTSLPPLYWQLRNARTTFLCVLDVL